MSQNHEGKSPNKLNGAAHVKIPTLVQMPIPMCRRKKLNMAAVRTGPNKMGEKRNKGPILSNHTTE